MDTEALFCKQRNEPITYEEFSEVGWSIEDYVRYLNICEIIRMYVSSVPYINSSIHENQRFETTVFYDIIKILTDFLEPFIGRPISLNWRFNLYSANSIYDSFSSNAYPEESPIVTLVTSEDFRFFIEKLLRRTFTGNTQLRIVYEEDKWEKESNEKIEAEIKRLYKQIYSNVEPKLPTDKSPYASWQEYSRKWSEFIEIEDLNGDIDCLSGILDDRKKIQETISNGTVYVYRGDLKCHTEHEIYEYQADIKLLDDKSTSSLYIEYCKDCNKLYIKYADYENWLKRFHFFPIKVKMENPDDTYYGWAERSPLMLNGYNVNAKSNLSSTERQKILAYMIDSKMMSKRQVLDYLETFITQASGRDSMDTAISKWREDKNFVLNYKLANNPIAKIISVKAKKQ